MRSINKVKLYFAYILVFEFALQSDAIIRPSDACGVFEATCPNKSCIAKNLICNGFHDCSDGSDEINCTRHCHPREFQCNNKRCVPKQWRCDSNDDCGDDSDEMHCSRGSHCEEHQFRCTFFKQCIPESFRCDRYADCADGSDELDCSTDGIIIPPPKVVQLQIGETFETTCTAPGLPLPDIVWRLNLRKIPYKCRTSNQNDVSTLTCPDIKEEDQGAYTCEGVHIKGSLFVAADTVLVVDKCPRGFFNKESHECISCFCSNVTKECSSANLYKYRLQPSFDSYELIAVKKDAHKAVFHITNERNYKNSQLQLTPASKGVHAQSELEVLPYLAMPQNLLGNQLQSYGGYLKYRLNISKYKRAAKTLIFPDVIIMGKNITLLHIEDSHQLKATEEISTQLIEGKWLKQGEEGHNRLATRGEIMMVLTSVQDILIKMQYTDGYLDTTVDNIHMDSASQFPDFKGLGRMSYVEKCRCPDGYKGLSCQERTWVLKRNCADIKCRKQQMDDSEEDNDY